MSQATIIVVLLSNSRTEASWMASPARSPKLGEYPAGGRLVHRARRSRSRRCHIERRDGAIMSTVVSRPARRAAARAARTSTYVNLEAASSTPASMMLSSSERPDSWKRYAFTTADVSRSRSTDRGSRPSGPGSNRRMARAGCPPSAHVGPGARSLGPGQRARRAWPIRDHATSFAIGRPCSVTVTISPALTRSR